MIFSDDKSNDVFKNLYKTNYHVACMKSDFLAVGAGQNEQDSAYLFVA
jgi:hypothetical protein